jgi:hypothetical protein
VTHTFKLERLDGARPDLLEELDVRGARGPERHLSDVDRVVSAVNELADDAPLLGAGVRDVLPGG